MALKPKAAHRKDITSGIGDMQHRHFATIATIICEIDDDVAERRVLAEAFADRLRYSNPKFDRDHFLRACQPI